MKINTKQKILITTLSIYIPLFLLFLYGAYTSGINEDRASYALNRSLPSVLAYHQLERSVLKMQKWITHICATRAEAGYNEGFVRAEKYFNTAKEDLAKLKELFKNNPVELQRISELENAIAHYYEIGDEVAKAYIEGGTHYGNAMLDVFSIVEVKLNHSLRQYISQYSTETFEINQSIENVLNTTKSLFIVMGLLSFFLSVVSYMFLVKRAELRKLNQKLSDAMDSLWGEMELATKIQTALLPSEPEITGYEITGYMMPANDVGGDYYDIINVENRNWIVIGDVSGHGVSAGLVMMMVQTSIQTVINQYPNIPPSELLTIINRVIIENIHRLGEDKYMTITILAEHNDGQFTFSGLHQDIMIYRRKTESVESIETTGTWIGILENLEGMNKDDTFYLDSGDVLLLYTDGITEAMDESNNMFTDKSISKILQKLGNNVSVEIMKNQILEELKPYRLRDDVTMVIARRL